MKYKQLKLPEELHKELKVSAAKRKITIIKFLKLLLSANKERVNNG